MYHFLEQFFSSKAPLEALKHFPKLKWDHLYPRSKKIDGLVHESAVISGRVIIGLETQIDPYVVIEDDVIIGKHCLIRSGALIRSGSIIGDNCVIGHGSEIKQSFLSDEVKIGSHCFVGNSVFGKGARMGSGSITGNRRFDQEDISWIINGEKIDSGQDKVGLLLGDYARLGASVTTNPGTIIGSYTWVSGGQVVSGFVESKKFVKPDGSIIDNNKAKDLDNKDKEGEK